MDAATIAAYIGAAAWLPQILTWIHQGLVRPVIVIVPDKSAEVGFTSFGPIFNLRMAFSAENKELIIDGFELLLRHSDGDVHSFRWAGMKETFSEITDALGNRQTVEKDQMPIALKVGTESLIEKFVRFQEPRFQDKDRVAISNLVAHFHFLKRNDPENYVVATLTSKELFSLIDARQKSFWWKPGQYHLEIRISSPKKFRVAPFDYQFELSQIDVDQMKQNIGTLDDDMKNLISSNLPDYKRRSISWNWANVDIHKT